jgi:hypothetical protein
MSTLAGSQHSLEPLFEATSTSWCSWSRRERRSAVREEGLSLAREWVVLASYQSMRREVRRHDPAISMAIPYLE